MPWGAINLPHDLSFSMRSYLPVLLLYWIYFFVLVIFFSSFHLCTVKSSIPYAFLFTLPSCVVYSYFLFTGNDFFQLLSQNYLSKTVTYPSHEIPGQCTSYFIFYSRNMNLDEKQLIKGKKWNRYRGIKLFFFSGVWNSYCRWFIVMSPS